MLLQHTVGKLQMLQKSIYDSVHSLCIRQIIWDLPSNDDNEVHNVPNVAQVGTFV